MKRFYEFALRPLATYEGLRSFSLLLLFIFLVPLTALSQKVKEIELISECVQYVGGDMYIAYFGYNNPNKNDISVPEDSSVVIYNYGQSKKNAVNSFKPGRHENVFSQTFHKNDKCDWELILPDGTKKIKSSSVNSSHTCLNSANIVPYFPPPENGRVEDSVINAALNSLYETVILYSGNKLTLLMVI